MLTYDQALRAIGKAINSLRREVTARGESMPPTPYVVTEIASRVSLDPKGEWYDPNLAYLANIRRLVDRMLRGDGARYLREKRRENHVDSVTVEDPLGADTDWRNVREAQRAIGRLFPNLSKGQKLKKSFR